jgi:hypothetical protein
LQFALLFLLLVPSWVPVTAGPEQSIEGKLVFSQDMPPCDLCKVRLISNRGHVVDTAYVRSDGEFTFYNVAEGLYTIHAEIVGYEEIRESIEISPDGLSQSSVALIMNPRVEIRPVPPSSSPVVTLP